MTQQNKKYVQWATIMIIVALLFVWWKDQSKPAQLDDFASCLKEKQAVFYGAFWCPHCQATKKMFGRSERLLPYVECATADGQGTMPACMDKGIQSYPTWVFADGSKETGELSLEHLAEKTGCQLPQPK